MSVCQVAPFRTGEKHHNKHSITNQTAPGCEKRVTESPHHMDLHQLTAMVHKFITGIPGAKGSPKRFKKALSKVHPLISHKLRLTRNAASPTALRRFLHPPLAYFSLLYTIISINVKCSQSIFLGVWMWSSGLIHLIEIGWKPEKDVIKVNNVLPVSLRFRHLTCKKPSDIKKKEEKSLANVLLYALNYLV